jgi:hypothetical protein
MPYNRGGDRVAGMRRHAPLEWEHADE